MISLTWTHIHTYIYTYNVHTYTCTYIQCTHTYTHTHIHTYSVKEIEDEEYNSFYKAFFKDYQDPLAKIHFTAEGEVTFRAIIFVPAVSH